jgi:hypothetical protein
MVLASVSEFPQESASEFPMVLASVSEFPQESA